MATPTKGKPSSRNVRTKATRRPARAKPRQQRPHRRWLLWAALVALLGLGLWACRRYCLPRPVPRGAHIDAIDVSHYQGEIDWHSVASVTDIHFAYVKATEGATWRDEFFADNVWRARDVGLHVGAYHLYDPAVSPEAQFQNFRAFTADADCDLIPCIDIEENVSRTDLCANVMRIAHLMEEHYGCKPLLYVNAHVYNDYLYPEAAGYELWIPNYSRKPVLRGPVRPFVWQYSENGQVPGIEGYVDLDCLVNGMTLERLLSRP